MSKLLHWGQWEADLYEDTPTGGIPSKKRPRLLFQTGFNPHVTVEKQSTGSCLLSGTDNSLKNKNNWQEDYQFNNKFFGDSNKIYYEAGNDSQRLASIVPDPDDPKNNVLKFWLKAPNGHGQSRGRIQLLSRTTLTDIRCDMKMRLGGYFNYLSTFAEPITWLTLAEFFTEPQQSPNDQFRIHVSINKSEGIGKPIAWAVHAEKLVTTDIPLETEPGMKTEWETVWVEYGDPVTAPVIRNQWFTLSIWLKQGRKKGRCKVLMTPEDGLETVICDRTDYTMNPEARYQDGYHGYQPLKIYTSPGILEVLNASYPDDAFEVYYDSYKVWANKPN